MRDVGSQKSVGSESIQKKEIVSKMSDDNKSQFETIENLREKYLGVEKKKHQLEKQIFWLNANLRAKRKAEFEKTLWCPDSASIDQEAQTLQNVLLAESEKLVTNLNEVKNELALKDAKIQILEAKIEALEKRGPQKPENIGDAPNRLSFDETPEETDIADDTIESQEAQIRALEIEIQALEKDRTDRQKIQLEETSEEERDIARQNEKLARRLREVGIEKRKLLQKINDLVQDKKKVKKEDRTEKKRLRSFDLRDDDVRNEPFVNESFK